MSAPDPALAAALAQLPRVDALLDAAPLRALGVQRTLLREAVRSVLEELREALRAGGDPVDAAVLCERVVWRVQAWMEPAPRAVINATGVLLHTNLGRAPLSGPALIAMRAAGGACDLELDLASGQRGSRFTALRPLLRVACEAEDAHVVTNGAAALLLACTALGRSAGRRGVILCRAQMVEIGDGFRIATMAAAGGVPVVEVGATNRSHLHDYAAALEGVQDATLEGEGVPAAAILWAHASNFAQSGFTKQPSLEDLATLARKHGVPLIADLGSGSLGGELPADEPTIQAYLRAGADLVTCSGDKLLGGPQAGIMAGRADLVERCRRFPMARALRPDKTILAGLHATLRAHMSDGASELPLHTMLRAEVEDLRARGEALVAQLSEAARQRGATLELATSTATIGGGAMPGDARASLALEIVGISARRLAADLRVPSEQGLMPVVGRVDKGRVRLDLRTVPEHFDAHLSASVLHALQRHLEPDAAPA